MMLERHQNSKDWITQGCPIKNDVYLGTDVKILH